MSFSFRNIPSPSWLLAISIVLAVFAESAASFDGCRRGFVLGGGIGFSPLVRASAERIPSDDKNASGIAADIFAGYGWSERNVVVFIYDAAFFKSDLATNSSGHAFQGFEGIGWLHYFTPAHKCIYVQVAAGLQHFNRYSGDFEPHDPGFAALFGGGYQFTGYTQIDVSFSLGKTAVSSVDFNHSQLIVTINAVAF